MIYKGFDISLNKFLVDKMSVSIHNQEELISLHKRRVDIYGIMSDNIDNFGKLKELESELTSLQFQAQELWGFPKDRNKHTWEFGLFNPLCKCQMMDYEMSVGKHHKSSECPLHSPEKERVYKINIAL